MYLISFHQVKSRLVKRVCKKDFRICWDKKLEKLKGKNSFLFVSRLQNISVIDVFRIFLRYFRIIYFSYPFVPVFKKNLYNNNILY